MTDRYHVVGVSGGEVQNSNVAGVVHGGMGNTSQDNRGSRNVKMGDQHGQFSMGDRASNVQGASNAQSKGQSTMTSSELVQHLRGCECSEATVEGFTKQRVTGSLFMSQFDEVLQLLNITDKFEVMRLKNLKKELSQ